MMVFRYILAAFIMLLVSSVSLSVSAGQYESQVKALDDYAEQAVKDWEVPGLVMTVVKDGETVFTKAWGVRTLGESGKVDTQTLFLCASTTKAFTAAALAMLVDEGKLQWDDPVSEYMPEFQLYDPFVTRKLTIRDLLVHRAGLGNSDFLWSVLDIPESEILYRMRYLKPSYPFRSGYTYQNIMYLAAGKLLEKVSGTSWADFVKTRIFEPLGMDRTFALKKQTEGMSGRASAHYKIDGKIQKITHSNADNIGPAGSMWSNVDDMSKWIKFLLDGGVVNGKRLLEPESVKELFTPQILIPQNQFYPTAQLTKPNWTSYGLAWFQHDYKGKKVDFHTGSLAGMVAIAGLIREENLGVYIMGNLDHAEVRHALMYKTFDLFLKDSKTDWSQDFLALYGEMKKAQEKARKNWLKQRVTNTRPSLPLKNYTGIYSDPLFGSVVVSQVNGGLELKFNDSNSMTLEHWHYDTFMGTWSKAWWSRSLAQFTLNAEGKVDQLNVGGMVYSKQR